LKLNTSFLYGYGNLKEAAINHSSHSLSIGSGLKYDLAEWLAPGIDMHYIFTHQNEYINGSGDEISGVNHHILLVTLGFGFKLSLLEEHLKFHLRPLAYYNIVNSNSNNYIISTNRGISYQLMDTSQNLARFSWGVGTNVSYRFSRNFKLTLSYNGRYSSSLTNHQIAGELEIRF
jgi:hypothetical protein